MPTNPRSQPTSTILCLVIAALALAVQGQATSQPTQAQLEQMVEAKAYRPALRAIAQILPFATPANAGGYDKYALFMLRGECLVQLKDASTATVAYEQAAKAAGTLPQDEAARAMLILVRRSPGLTYTPRTGQDKTPLDLLNPDTRKRAMVALLNDELKAAAKQFGDAVTAKSLPPILALAPALRDLHAIEAVGTGDDKQTIALVQPVGDRVYELIDAELNRLDQQVAAIQRAAERVVANGSGSFQMNGGQAAWVPTSGTTGLTNENRQALRENIAYAGKIGQTCEDLTAMARRYERDGKRWQALAKRAQGLIDLATAVYDHE